MGIQVAVDILADLMAVLGKEGVASRERRDFRRALIRADMRTAGSGGAQDPRGDWGDQGCRILRKMEHSVYSADRTNSSCARDTDD